MYVFDLGFEMNHIDSLMQSVLPIPPHLLLSNQEDFRSLIRTTHTSAEISFKMSSSLDLPTYHFRWVLQAILQAVLDPMEELWELATPLTKLA